MLILPGYWPDTYWADRYWTADYWPEFGSAVGPPVSTDRPVRRTRRPGWKFVNRVVVARTPLVVALIEKQKFARDGRLEQERLAVEENARRDALLAEADQIMADLHAKREREAVIAEKRLRNLAVAQVIQRRKRAEEKARQKEIRKKRLKALRKARARSKK